MSVFLQSFVEFFNNHSLYIVIGSSVLSVLSLIILLLLRLKKKKGIIRSLFTRIVIYSLVTLVVSLLCYFTQFNDAEILIIVPVLDFFIYCIRLVKLVFEEKVEKKEKGYLVYVANNDPILKRPYVSSSIAKSQEIISQGFQEIERISAKINGTPYQNITADTAFRIIDNAVKSSEIKTLFPNNNEEDAVEVLDERFEQSRAVVTETLEDINAIIPMFEADKPKTKASSLTKKNGDNKSPMHSYYLLKNSRERHSRIRELLKGEYIEGDCVYTLENVKIPSKSKKGDVSVNIIDFIVITNHGLWAVILSPEKPYAVSVIPDFVETRKTKESPLCRCSDYVYKDVATDAINGIYNVLFGLYRSGKMKKVVNKDFICTALVLNEDETVIEAQRNLDIKICGENQLLSILSKGVSKYSPINDNDCLDLKNNIEMVSSAIPDKKEDWSEIVVPFLKYFFIEASLNNISVDLLPYREDLKTCTISAKTPQTIIASEKSLNRFKDYSGKKNSPKKTMYGVYDTPIIIRLNCDKNEQLTAWYELKEIIYDSKTKNMVPEKSIIAYKKINAKCSIFTDNDKRYPSCAVISGIPRSFATVRDSEKGTAYETNAIYTLNLQSKRGGKPFQIPILIGFTKENPPEKTSFSGNKIKMFPKEKNK